MDNSKKTSDVGRGIYYKVKEGKFTHDCLKKSDPHLMASIFLPNTIFCTICKAQWTREDRLQRIPHKFECPDCLEKFTMDVDMSDMMEIEPKFTFRDLKEVVEWGAYLCPKCSSKTNI